MGILHVQDLQSECCVNLSVVIDWSTEIEPMHIQQNWSWNGYLIQQALGSSIIVTWRPPVHRSPSGQFWSVISLVAAWRAVLTASCLVERLVHFICLVCSIKMSCITLHLSISDIRCRLVCFCFIFIFPFLIFCAAETCTRNVYSSNENVLLLV